MLRPGDEPTSGWVPRRMHGYGKAIESQGVLLVRVPRAQGETHTREGDTTEASKRSGGGQAENARASLEQVRQRVKRSRSCREAFARHDRWGEAHGPLAEPRSLLHLSCGPRAFVAGPRHA